MFFFACVAGLVAAFVSRGLVERMSIVAHIIMAIVLTGKCEQEKNPGNCDFRSFLYGVLSTKGCGCSSLAIFSPFIANLKDHRLREFVSNTSPQDSVSPLLLIGSGLLRDGSTRVPRWTLDVPPSWMMLDVVPSI